MAKKLHTGFESSSELVKHDPAAAKEQAKREKKRKQEEAKANKKGFGKMMKDSVSNIADIFEKEESVAATTTPEEMWGVQKRILELQEKSQDSLDRHADAAVEELQKAGEDLSTIADNQQTLYDKQKEIFEAQEREMSEREEFYTRVEKKLAEAEQARTINSFVEWGKTVFIFAAGIFGCVKLSKISSDVQDIRRGED